MLEITTLKNHISYPPACVFFSQQLYRDCLRVIKHMAPGGGGGAFSSSTPKAIALLSTLRREFRKPYETETDILNAKQSAVRALANYVLITSAPKDAALSSAMKDYTKRSVDTAKQEQQQQQQQQNDNLNQIHEEEKRKKGQ